MHNLPFFNASVRRPLKFCRYIHQERCTTRSGICCWYESRDYDDQKCLAIMADTLQVQKASFGQNLLFSTRQPPPDSVIRISPHFSHSDIAVWCEKEGSEVPRGNHARCDKFWVATRQGLDPGRAGAFFGI